LPNKPSYDELHQAYLDLQLRVTRFSAKEQELINARNLLDRELLGYKRMNDFHVAAIDLRDIPSLLTLIAETVVDLFDVEIGYACFRELSAPSFIQCHLEGGIRQEELELKEALKEVCLNQEGESHQFVEEDSRGFALARYMVGKKAKADAGVEMVVVGAVSRKKKDTYDRFNHRRLAIFKLFLESCSAFLSSINAGNRINEQLETIRESELELRRLSLIATKTHSGVVVTDATGNIEWVNEAFKACTGYLEGDVIGRNPLRFLQMPGLNDPAALEALSAAIQNRERINLDLKNRKKNGELFYFRLSITPVFDQEDRLINFIAIQQDITAQKVGEQRLVEKNQELTKINKELDQFVYSISHDLRAPLLSIQGLLGLIQFDTWDAGNQEFLNLIAESTNRLDHTILEILNYSRNARMDISLQPFNLKESIRDILIDLSSLRLGVETSFEWEGSDVVKQDEVRVGVLLKNILANAIKYSKGEAGEAFVKVNVYVNDEGFKIVISDNGEGIEEVHLEKVFDMFYRATNSSPGTGLGLYISKEITDKLGGTISIASSRGVGTEVTITLPQQAHEQIPTH